jgi:uncharacterized protein
MEAISPTHERERIPVLDALRGIALFGILMVNMRFFKSLSTVEILPASSSIASPLDRAAFFAIEWLFMGKFYSIFAFLFGLGLALQMGRLETRGLSATPILVRRLLVLLFIGLAHALFIWAGDVLFFYALAGLVLILLRNLRTRELLIWGIALWGIQAMCCFGAGGLTLWAAAWSGQVPPDDFFAGLVEPIREAYLQAGYFASLPYRVLEWSLMMVNGIFFIPNVLMMFLLGFYLGKQRIVEQLSEHRRLLTRAAAIGIGLGLPVNGVVAWELLHQVAQNQALPAYGWLMMLIPSAPLQAVGYMAVFGLLWETLPAFRRLMTPVAAAGRTALSVYLTQSVICTLLFSGYGLGLYGKVSMAQGVALTCAIWAAQVLLSAFWLSRFRYGPVEWLWRSLTYRQRMPMVIR